MKRQRPEDECGTGTGPYTTYQEVHDDMASLQGIHSQDAISGSVQRAISTFSSQDVPSAVRQLSIRFSLRLCTHPAADTRVVVAGLVSALRANEAVIRCEIYQALNRLHELKGIFAANVILDADKATLDSTLLKDLNNAQHHLRCASLELVASVRPNGVCKTKDIFDTICRYTTDSHPKVRQAALTVLFKQHMMGVELPVEMYDECVAATKDDFEKVRLVAVELVWAISNAHPEHPVSIHKYRVTETIRLLDDAFVKVCDMVNDSSISVRQKACTILGRFKNVDIRFLSQTFSKQVMSHLRRYVPRGMHHQSGRGRDRPKSSQSSIPTPEGDVDVESDEFKLLDSGAAGAFVHGLEDEFQEVRDAAIESITELSIASIDFAAKAVDFLVDMFNDSSDRVRMCANQALIAIGNRSLIALTEEQLSIALSAMKDASKLIRDGIYSFLAVSKLENPAWLERLMNGFKDGMERYPEDQPEIYHALRSIGSNHTSIIDSEFALNLFKIDAHYLSREERMDDIVYAGNVILVMNTGLQNRKQLAHVLPEFIFNHLPYIRDKYDGSLPENIAESVPSNFKFVKQMLERPAMDSDVEQTSSNEHRNLVTQSLVHIKASIDTILNRDQHVHEISSPLIDKIVHQIHSFETLQKYKMPTSILDVVFVDYSRLVVRCLRLQLLSTASSIRKYDLLELVADVMRDSYAIEYRHIGLNPECQLALLYIRLLAHASWLLLHLQENYEYSRGVREKMSSEFISRVDRNHQLVSSSALTHIGELDRLKSTLCSSRKQGKTDTDPKSNEGDEMDNLVSPSAVRQFVSSFKPLQFNQSDLCLRTRACFLRQAYSKRTLEFNHLFPVDLEFEVDVENLLKRQNLLVVATLPEKQKIVFVPPSSAFYPLSKYHYKVNWQVPVTLPLSSGEDTAIELSIKYKFEADLAWSDHLMMQAKDLGAVHGIRGLHKLIEDAHDSRVHFDVSDRSLNIKLNPVRFKPPSTAQTHA